MESLDQRLLLHGAGLGASEPLPWFDPGALTYSFAPDGTSVAGNPSSLFERLEPLGQEAWQRQFDLALNAWLEPLGVSARQVADSGSRFGISGRTQGDARFGDVRIAAIPLSPTVLASSVPPSAMVQGTWAGDILINANADWSSVEDVFAVALHEFGHVLGLGHSSDPLSVMYKHGLSDVLAPTPADIAALQDAYVGIRFEDEDPADSDDSDVDDRSFDLSDQQLAEPGEEQLEDPPEDPSSLEGVDALPFDPAAAEVLNPSIGSTIRYVALGGLSASQPQTVFRLEPTAVEAKDVEYLTVTLQSLAASNLDVEISVFAASGKKLESEVLHHGQGSVVVQIRDIDTDQPNYVVVEPSMVALESTRFGEFEVVMDVMPELRESRDLGEAQLDTEVPVVEIPLSVASSRLVHVHLESEDELDGQSAIFAWLLDSNDRVWSQLVMRPGTSRSAPLALLESGDYRLVLLASSPLSEFEFKVNLRIDEVSIDVGPGIVNPTSVPFLGCEEPGADPSYCYTYVPVTVGPPAPPTTYPEPSYSTNYPWWYPYGYSCTDYSYYDLGTIPRVDPLWWEFYVQACGVVTSIPSNPVPSNPVPSNPVPSNPAPISPVPINPAPINPAPINPAPINPAPISPVPVEPAPVEPVTIEPVTIEPVTIEPVTIEPVTIEPVTINPAPVELIPVEPAPVESAAIDPVPVDPVPVDPVPVDPVPVDPVPVSAWGSPRQNPQNIYDVSGDAVVTAQDALMIINELERQLSSRLDVSGIGSDFFLDVNGDHFVTALDALIVINSFSNHVAAAELVPANGVAGLSVVGLTVREDEGSLTTDLAIGQLF